jgi:hypothetical protein
MNLEQSFFKSRGQKALPKYCLPLLNKGCVTHCGLAIYISKYLKAKQELLKLKYFNLKKYNLQKKKPFKRNQNPSRYHNPRTNLKFQHKPKYHLPKNPKPISH